MDFVVVVVGGIVVLLPLVEASTVLGPVRP